MANEHPYCYDKDRWFQCDSINGDWASAREAIVNVYHNREVDIRLFFFGIEIPVLYQSRNFNANASIIQTSSIEGFVFGEDSNSAGETTVYPCGVVSSGSYSGDFTEDYSVTASKIHYIDPLEKIICWTEITHHLYFSKLFSKEDVVYFRTPYTQEPFFYAEFGIPTTKGTSTVKLYKNGTITTLSTVPLAIPAMEQELRVVFPHPTCTLTPAIGNPVTNAEWYDYCKYRTNYVGAIRNFDKMLLDGGDDFYYPEWLRNIDNHLNIEKIQKRDAEMRYNAVWVPPYKSEQSFPIAFDGLPIGYNILVDFVTNDSGTFYSIFGENAGEVVSLNVFIEKDTNVEKSITQDIMSNVYVTDGSNKIPFSSYSFTSFMPMGLI